MERIYGQTRQSGLTILDPFDLTKSRPIQRSNFLICLGKLRPGVLICAQEEMEEMISPLGIAPVRDSCEKVL
jgi:hypothetical protein